MRGRRVLTLKNGRLPSLFNGAINKSGQRRAPIPTPSSSSPSSLPSETTRPPQNLPFFSETEMALDSVPSYPSDLGSSRARTPQQQRVSPRKEERTWTTDTYAPYDDGHQWRKYGEKKLSNSNFPSSGRTAPTHQYLPEWKCIVVYYNPNHVDA
uniref:WRKY domain-containing protein n=1 Tax=Oryza glumipatula TaxID=40148 RepID=A0A0E0BN19_9ORYZ